MEENEDDKALYLEARIAICGACRFGAEPCICGDNVDFLIEDWEDDNEDEEMSEFDEWLEEQEWEGFNNDDEN